MPENIYPHLGQPAMPPNSRDIFGPYFNGEGMRWIDPLTVRRRYQHACMGKFDQMLADRKSQDEDTKFKATEGLIRGTVYAFSLVPFDEQTGKGMSETAVLALLRQFVQWCEDIKKKPDPSLTSPPATASGPPPSSPSPTNTSSAASSRLTGLRTVSRKLPESA